MKLEKILDSLQNSYRLSTKCDITCLRHMLHEIDQRSEFLVDSNRMLILFP